LTLDPDDPTASLPQTNKQPRSRIKHEKKTGKLTVDLNFYDVLISQSYTAAK
jgi:hypothetical protein